MTIALVPMEKRLDEAGTGREPPQGQSVSRKFHRRAPSTAAGVARAPSSKLADRIKMFDQTGSGPQLQPSLLHQVPSSNGHTSAPMLRTASTGSRESTTSQKSADIEVMLPLSERIARLNLISETLSPMDPERRSAVAGATSAETPRIARDQFKLDAEPTASPIADDIATGPPVDYDKSTNLLSTPTNLIDTKPDQRSAGLSTQLDTLQPEVNDSAQVLESQLRKVDDEVSSVDESATKNLADPVPFSSDLPNVPRSHPPDATGIDSTRGGASDINSPETILHSTPSQSSSAIDASQADSVSVESRSREAPLDQKASARPDTDTIETEAAAAAAASSQKEDHELSSLQPPLTGSVPALVVDSEASKLPEVIEAENLPDHAPDPAALAAAERRRRKKKLYKKKRAMAKQAAALATASQLVGERSAYNEAEYSSDQAATSNQTIVDQAVSQSDDEAEVSSDPSKPTSETHSSILEQSL